MRVKFGFFIAGFLFTLLLLISCGKKGPDGDVYVGFTWAYAPDYFYCDDWHIPTTIYIDTYYRTAPGEYYLEYHHSESDLWHYLYYELVAHEGKPGGLFTDGAKGEDAQFIIGIWAYSEPEVVQVKSVTETNSLQDDCVKSSSMQWDSTGLVKKQLYQYSETKGNYTIRVRGGVFEPAK